MLFHKTAHLSCSTYQCSQWLEWIRPRNRYTPWTGLHKDTTYNLGNKVDMNSNCPGCAGAVTACQRRRSPKVGQYGDTSRHSVSRRRKRKHNEAWDGSELNMDAWCSRNLRTQMIGGTVVPPLRPWFIRPDELVRDYTDRLRTLGCASIPSAYPTKSLSA
jgi:hypothetical protein